MRELHDHYFREAKREGYASRAAYKLIEIDERRRVLAKGDRVLDCGAAPGSWLQVAAQRVGSRGVVVGIDLREIQLSRPIPNVHVMQGDLRTVDDETLLAPIAPAKHFDVVVSDMAPDTTGDQTIDHHASIRLCTAVLDRGRRLLRPGGNIVMKVFEGEAYPDLVARVRRTFEHAKGFRPQASRKISREMFVIGHGYRGETDPGSSETPDPHAIAPPRPRPAPGWGARG